MKHEPRGARGEPDGEPLLDPGLIVVHEAADCAVAVRSAAASRPSRLARLGGSVAQHGVGLGVDIGLAD
eukprot:2050052-Alexandrium_andersonii.AAC.1